MVKSVVYHHEPVVDMWSLPDINRSVLVVMPFDIKLQLTVNTPCIYGSRNARLPLVEECQNGFVNIVVNKDNPILRSLDEVADEHIGIEYLSVKQDAFFWWQRGMEKEIDFS